LVHLSFQEEIVVHKKLLGLMVGMALGGVSAAHAAGVTDAMIEVGCTFLVGDRLIPDIHAPFMRWI